eukprot:SRR837773.10867.p4 GENE.SRR837773.10867~~SRR837773.10867.p4  ORF type:complete len:108 (+),score=0.14 SRR837773.10867:445-768(+)
MGAPKGQAVGELALPELRHTRSATPIARHHLVRCIGAAQLVEVLVVHVGTPPLEGAKHHMLSNSVTVPPPTPRAPAHILRCYHGRYRQAVMRRRLSVGLWSVDQPQW